MEAAAATLFGLYAAILREERDPVRTGHRQQEPAHQGTNHGDRSKVSFMAIHYDEYAAGNQCSYGIEQQNDCFDGRYRREFQNIAAGSRLLLKHSFLLLRCFCDQDRGDHNLLPGISF